VRRVALSGLVALAALLGGVAVPAAALAQPTAAARVGRVVATRPGTTARPADDGGAKSGTLVVSCVLRTDCLAVQGSSSQSGGETSSIPTRVERWNGASWKRLGVSMPKATKSDDLNDVSCKGAKSCLAVGDYYTSASGGAMSHPLALIYNGTSLKPTPTVPVPKSATDVALTGVSCATTRHCVALAMADVNTGISLGNDGPLIIVETWNGAKWAMRTITTPANKFVQVSGVSCATSTFCVISGTSYSQTSSGLTMNLYLASWNGKKLTMMKSDVAGLASSSNLVVPLDVSCATPSNCASTGENVGDINSSTPTITAYTAIWNGRTWQLAKARWPAGIADSGLAGVSCYAAHACEAVGVEAANVEKSFQAAAVSYQGTAGTVQAVPAPPKGDLDVFYDVSCLPWGSCVAVGETGKTTAAPDAAITGVWNGKGWKLDPGF
jgi:hypothetical protein